MALNLTSVFPLGTVLFPDTPIHLHIFEPRYQKMMQKLLGEKQGFVVSLIKTGQEALGELQCLCAAVRKSAVIAKDFQPDGFDMFLILALGHAQGRGSKMDE